MNELYYSIVFNYVKIILQNYNRVKNSDLVFDSVDFYLRNSKI